MVDSTHGDSSGQRKAFLVELKKGDKAAYSVALEKLDPEFHAQVTHLENITDDYQNLLSSSTEKIEQSLETLGKIKPSSAGTAAIATAVTGAGVAIGYWTYRHFKQEQAKAQNDRSI